MRIFLVTLALLVALAVPSLAVEVNDPLVFSDSVLDEQAEASPGPEPTDAPEPSAEPSASDILTSVSDIINDALSSMAEDQLPGQPIVIVQHPEAPAPADDSLLLADPTPSPVADAWIYDEGYGIQTYTLNPVTSASGLKGVMLDVLGSYDAIVVEHRYQHPSSGSYSYVRDIQPDYPWIASVVVFVVVLYCCIRLGAALLCRK